jgi:hypothetical protein
MSMPGTERFTLSRLVVAAALLCLLFGFNAMAQTSSNTPLDEEAVTALVDERKEGLPDLIDAEDQVTAITKKRDAREAHLSLYRR